MHSLPIIRSTAIRFLALSGSFEVMKIPKQIDESTSNAEDVDVQNKFDDLSFSSELGVSICCVTCHLPVTVSDRLGQPVVGIGMC